MIAVIGARLAQDDWLIDQLLISSPDVPDAPTSDIMDLLCPTVCYQLSGALFPAKLPDGPQTSFLMSCGSTEDEPRHTFSVTSKRPGKRTSPVFLAQDDSLWLPWLTVSHLESQVILRQAYFFKQNRVMLYIEVTRQSQEKLIFKLFEMFSVLGDMFRQTCQCSRDTTMYRTSGTKLATQIIIKTKQISLFHINYNSKWGFINTFWVLCFVEVWSSIFVSA